jgi:hypothetical protein
MKNNKRLYNNLLMFNIIFGLLILITSSYIFFGRLIVLDVLIAYLMNIFLFLISLLIIRKSINLPNKKFTLNFFSNSVIRIFIVLILLFTGILILNFDTLKYTLALMFFYFYSSVFEIYFFVKFKKLKNII